MSTDRIEVTQKNDVPILINRHGVHRTPIIHTYRMRNGRVLENMFAHVFTFTVWIRDRITNAGVMLVQRQVLR